MFLEVCESYHSDEEHYYGLKLYLKLALVLKATHHLNSERKN